MYADRDLGVGMPSGWAGPPESTQGGGSTNPSHPLPAHRIRTTLPGCPSRRGASALNVRPKRLLLHVQEWQRIRRQSEPFHRIVERSQIVSAMDRHILE